MSKINGMVPWQYVQTGEGKEQGLYKFFHIDRIKHSKSRKKTVDEYQVAVSLATCGFLFLLFLSFLFSFFDGHVVTEKHDPLNNFITRLAEANHDASVSRSNFSVYRVYNLLHLTVQIT